VVCQLVVAASSRFLCRIDDVAVIMMESTVPQLLTGGCLQ
jgi:hypothetical protein